MAKKKDEKDVLVVRDEKTGEISVVAGLNADGTPKRTPAKAENAQSFLQFDRHGDVLDHFFKNFFRQCKEPSRFGFYRIAADQVDSMLGVMKDLLQHPYQNKQILAPHKIDTFPYQQQVQEEMAAQKTEKQEPQKQENMEQQKEQQECEQIAFFDFIVVFHIRNNLGFLIEQRKYSCKYFHTGNDAVLFAEKLYRSLAGFWHDSIRGYIFTGDIFLQRQQQQIIHI